jgi:hypothetical protein
MSKSVAEKIVSCLYSDKGCWMYRKGILYKSLGLLGFLFPFQGKYKNNNIIVSKNQGDSLVSEIVGIALDSKAIGKYYTECVRDIVRTVISKKVNNYIKNGDRITPEEWTYHGWVMFKDEEISQITEQARTDILKEIEKCF